MDFRIVGLIFVVLGSVLLVNNLRQEPVDQMRVYLSIAMIGYGLYRAYQGFQQKQ